MASKFHSRSEEQEMMDDLDCSGQVIDQTLKELETINRLLGGNYVTINGLAKLYRRNPAMKNETITVADLGCGGGDILKLIAKWARKKDFKVQLIGIDANSNIIDYASDNTSEFPEISYQSINIFSEEFKKQRFDVIVSTLFTHHFTGNELTNLFGQLSQQVKYGIIINDIHRHPLAYYSIKMLTRFFSRSEMVKYDAPLSVLRAFKSNELKHILQSASIKKYQIKWMWAFRWQLIF
ncbi:MAG: methyltransferase domain-containing protein [Bacteroidota bacterium]